MEINNFSQSSIYQELAQERNELANIDKKDIEKSTQESYDKVNISDNKYDKKDASTEVDDLNSADAQITKTANLNRLLLQSLQESDVGVTNEN